MAQISNRLCASEGLKRACADDFSGDKAGDLYLEQQAKADRVRQDALDTLESSTKGGYIHSLDAAGRISPLTIIHQKAIIGTG